MKRAIAGLVLLAALRMGTPAMGSPIAYWAADGNTVDSEAARNGTLVNGAGFGAGAVNQAFSLDGANDYVSVPDDSVWTLGGDFTIALWANFDAIKTGTFATAPNVFIAHDQGSGVTPKWIFFFDDGGQLVFHINGGAPIFLASPSTFMPAIGDWHHYAVTRSGTTFTFFADGTSLGTVISAATLFNPAAPLTIGQAEGLGFFDGRLDEIRLYSDALSASQIAALAAVPEPGSMMLLGIGAIALILGRKRGASVRLRSTARSHSPSASCS